jgi:multiple sugar transport system permease protein
MKQLSRWWEPWVLVTPGILLFTVFSLVPVVTGLLGSFVEFGYYGRGWIGFGAWSDVLSSEVWWKSVKTTLLFMGVMLPTIIAGALFVAVVLSWANQTIQVVMRTAFYVPATVSILMLAIMWHFIVVPEGLLNRILGTDILWVASNPYAFWTLSVLTSTVLMGTWIIYLMAALSSIDSTLYEAARIDGCTRWQEARYITIPGIRPIIVFTSVMAFVGLLQYWEVPYAMTGGGPNYGTSTMMLLIYQEGVVSGRMAQASAMTTFLLALAMGCLGLYRLISRRRLLF